MLDDKYSFRDLVNFLREPDYRVQNAVKQHSTGRNAGHAQRYTHHQLRVLKRYFAAAEVWRAEQGHFKKAFNDEEYTPG